MAFDLPFFVVSAEYAGQGLSYKKFNVELLEGTWPHVNKLALYLGGWFGGSYMAGDTGHRRTLFAYTD
jgi:hypothetical protein